MACHGRIDPRALRTSEAPEDATQGVYRLSHGVNAHSTCTVWSIAFMNFYSLWNCIFYNAGSSITREAFSRLVGGDNIVRSKLSSGVLLSRVPS